MIERSKDWAGLLAVMHPLNEEWLGFDESIVLKSENVLLTDGVGNYGLFEYDSPGKYYGHYLFGNARGRDAFYLAEDMLEQFFSTSDAVTILGLTPTEHKGALWLNKRLGFKTLNIVETEVGPHELVYLNKKDFMNE